MTRRLVAALVLVAAVGAAPGTASASVALKEPVRGLVDRQEPAAAPYDSVVDAFVIRVKWKDLQPTREAGADHGGALVTTAIDAALWNTRESGQPVRLRVTAGVDAPQWTHTLGGEGPVDWRLDDGATVPIGPFWNAAFGTAYDKLHELLAARYESNPRVREVAVARCTTEFAEPYIRQAGQAAVNGPELAGTSYTRALDEECHRQEILTHARWWNQTRSYLAFNPYQRLEQITRPNGTKVWRATADPAFTTEMIDYCVSQLGQRCVLGNNSLDPDRPQDYLDMYAHMASKGVPVAFQTATAAKICNNEAPCPIDTWNATLQMAVDHNAGSVELPRAATGYTSWPIADPPTGGHGLAYYDDLLEA